VKLTALIAFDQHGANSTRSEHHKPLGPVKATEYIQVTSNNFLEPFRNEFTFRYRANTLLSKDAELAHVVAEIEKIIDILSGNPECVTRYSIDFVIVCFD
jgi:hypothetical protein